MERGPRWTLRLAALALGSTPFLHLMFAPAGGGVFQPFQDLHVLGRMFERAPAGWLFCWVLPFLASLPSWRSDWVTSGFTFAAYSGLMISLLGGWSPSLPTLVLVLGAFFLIGLLLFRLEVEVVAAWARLLLAVGLLAACAEQMLDHPALSVGSVGVGLGALFAGLGEYMALRGVPAEEPEPSDP
ncbi:MAG TPA: hypothetical protein VF950_02490 [Planctomycetota bacterium]